MAPANSQALDQTSNPRNSDNYRDTVQTHRLFHRWLLANAQGLYFSVRCIFSPGSMSSEKRSRLLEWRLSTGFSVDPVPKYHLHDSCLVEFYFFISSAETAKGKFKTGSGTVIPCRGILGCNHVMDQRNAFRLAEIRAGPVVSSSQVLCIHCQQIPTHYPEGELILWHKWLIIGR